VLPEGEVQLGFLADAAAAALALPDLRGCRREVVATRRALVQVAARVPTGELAAQLGIAAFSVRRLRAERVDARLVRAVTLQARLRAALSL
jgi:hypothetical protein